ncbi:MAG: oligosaccharide flippase family protein [candidate division KSB1 bacterium]|nr:oligosaccharide flippase family protein [candidate division KSB1 bacterium]
MSVARRLVFNTGARSAAEFINRGGTFLFWMMTARTLGASALGSLAFALSLFNLFNNFCHLGLTNVVVREAARTPQKAGLYYSHSLMLFGATSLISALGMIGLVLLMRPQPDTIFASIALATALVPASAFFAGRSLLYAAEQLPKVSLAYTGESLFKTLFGLAALQLGADVRTIAVIIALSKVLPTIILLPYVHRLVKPEWRLDAPTMRFLVSMIPSFSLINISNSLFWTAPTLLLTKLCGEETAGIYNAAHKVADLTLCIPNAYGQAILPTASKMLAAKPRHFRFLFVRSLKYMFIMTVALAAMISFGAEQIIRLLYGQHLAAAALVLKLLAWLLVPFSLVPIFSAALLSGNLQKHDLAANAAAAATAAAVVTLAAPYMGPAGAAVAYLAGAAVFMVIEWASVYRRLFRFSMACHLWRPSLGALLMIIVLTGGRFPGLGNLFMGAGVYLVFLALSKTITRSEWLMIKNLQTV